jgi:hypothetical protein
MRCKAYSLSKVKGELVVQDFLNVVSYKIALE